ncbi:MAG: succinate dehydrogenase/fumarate reductase iron-sulfur subunit [Lachnospiraceae bacterium]|nr:succinate dehydrogenase/fumarate reductase iron-sulfur subunit [Lachnospiraceae bacterium]
MRVRVRRQASPVSNPYWQEFNYEKRDERTTVAGMLEELNYLDDLKDVSGNTAPRIQWERSCLQGMCGGCAMVINSRPALACETFLGDIKKNTIVLEPLRKFPVIADLIVDRSIIDEILKKESTFIEEFKGADPAEYDHMYAAGKCLKCGLCLEVCPNYSGGRSFYGAAFANDCYLITSRSRTRDKALKESYKEHFARGCSKSLSCVDICPMKIPTLASISKMNKGL